MRLNKILMTILLGAAAAASVSCDRFFEPSLGNRLEEDENYTGRSTIYASYIGLYALLQDAAAQLVVVSELRGDLIQPTSFAPDDYWDIYRNTVTDENEAANPEFLYKIVVNCNDFLRNAVAYNKSYPGVIPETIYRQMIAGTVTLRAWAYLNIGKLYGGAVYYDYSLTGDTDISDIVPTSLDELVPELISFMQRGVDGINGLRYVNLNNMFGTSGIWSNLPVNPDALMLELYLWHGDYENAAKRGINMITGQAVTAAGDNHSYTCSYQFGGGSGALKKWSTMFSETPVAVHGKEGATIVLFDYAQRQVNPLYSIFSNETGCDYWLKPTNVLVNSYSGSDYKSGAVTVADPRGSGVTFETVNGNRVLYKYATGRSLQASDTPIYLYRASEIHLMIAEALSALGNYDAADAIVNVGFQPYWEAGNRYNPPFDAPIYAYEKLKAGHGVRGRLGIPPVLSTSERFIPEDVDPSSEEYSMRRAAVLDSLIIEETGRELAGEGKKWFTMLRMARNHGYDELLARMISNKYQSGRNERYDEFLDRGNWFIKYNHKEN